MQAAMRATVMADPVTIPAITDTTAAMPVTIPATLNHVSCNDGGTSHAQPTHTSTTITHTPATMTATDVMPTCHAPGNLCPLRF